MVSEIKLIEHSDKPGIHIEADTAIKKIDAAVPHTLSVRKGVVITIHAEDGSEITIKPKGPIGVMRVE